MKTNRLIVLLAAILLSACGGSDPLQPSDPAPAAPVSPYQPSIYKWGLRDLGKACGVKIGAAATWSDFGDDSLRVILKRDFEAVTFGNEMKHDAIVQASGELNFARADEMAGWTKDCGAELFGHTLGWHSQQQTDYLNKLIADAPDEATAAARIREAHKSWVDAMVAHFDVYAWDVVNEVFNDDGSWRSSSTTQPNYHVFVWGNYYPDGMKGFVDAAFRSAREALEREGKKAELYINDYNLEWSDAKLEALCKYAEGNPDVTGVGTQMHISADVDRKKVSSMLERMVKTGKKVRISELDVTVGNTSQAETIVYIFDQYLKLVPAAQRGGITFWGVSDKRSWLGADKQPLLYNSLYRRKDAYLRLHEYLLDRSGLK